MIGVALTRIRGRRAAVVVACALVTHANVVAHANVAHAQAKPARVSVSGITFDSLRSVPLTKAFVMIDGQSRSTVSDEKGRFTFDTLAPGVYTFAMQHAALDSLGLSGATARAVVSDGRALVTLAVPSFATMWRAACGAIPVPPADTGLIYGSIRDAQQQRAVAQASVQVSWLDLVNRGTKQAANLSQRRWKLEAQADAQGGYAVCGVPVHTQLQLRANYLMNATGALQLPVSADRVRRRDLMLAGTRPIDSLLRGAVSGTISDGQGKPVEGARVILDDVTEARTDASGRFTMRGVHTGTRQVDVAAIGMTPVSTLVDVPAGDTAFVTAAISRVTNLEALNITASGRRSRAVVLFEERRQQGFGKYLDSMQIGRRATLAGAFAGFPGVVVEAASPNGRRFKIYLPSTGESPCLAMLQVDGVPQPEHDILNTLHPTDVAAIEVYTRRTTLPTEFMKADGKCGVVAVWTKRAFR